MAGFYTLALLAPAVAGASLGLAAAAALVRRDAPPILTREMRVTVAVAVAMVVAALISYLAGTANDEGALLLTRFAILPLGLIAAWRAPTFDAVRAVWFGCTAGSICAGALAILEVGPGGAPRADGAVNAIAFGDLSLLMACMSIAALSALAPRPRIASAWSLAAFTAGLIASTLSGSRGGWLALPVFLGLLAFQHRRRPAWQLACGLAIAVIAIAGAIQIGHGRPSNRVEVAVAQVREYPGSGLDDAVRTTSVGLRLEMWLASLAAFQDHPALGLGWGNLQEHFQHQALDGRRAPEIAQFTHAHNQYLTSLATGGPLGLLTWILILAVPAGYLARALTARTARERSMATVGLLLIAGYAIFGITETLAESTLPLTFYALTIGLLLREQRPISPHRSQRGIHWSRNRYRAVRTARSSDRTMAAFVAERDP